MDCARFIIIKGCNSPTAWYSDRVGYIFQTDNEVEFPNAYTVKISNRKDRANYGVVNLEDAEVVTPSIIERIKTVLGCQVRTS